MTMDEAIAVFILLAPLLILPVGFCIVCCGEIRRETEEQERNAAELAQRLAAERTRRWSAAEQARRSASAEQPGRLEAAAAAAEQAWRFPAAAAAPAVKKELGCFPYSAVVEGRRGRSSGQRQLECAICLEVFVHAATCSEVPWCRHLFHRDCIARWMTSKSTCPLCRVSIVPGLSEPLSAAEYMV